MSGYTFERQSKYCVLKFTPELTAMPWADVESATNKVTELVHDDDSNSVLVDLSELQSMPSGIVASLVRTWKGMDEKSRQLVVVSTSDAVTNDLEQTGLTSLWTLTSDHTSAYKALGVSPPVDNPPEPEKTESSEPAANEPVSSDPYSFKEHRSFCAVSMNPVLMEIGWEEMEKATTDVIERFKTSSRKNALVDVSRMEYINSGLVAALVRIWKATKEVKGNFTLVSPNELVTGVLKSAGLWKMWNVVEDRDEAVFGIGASTASASTTSSAPTEKPAATPASVICAVVAVTSMGVMLFGKDQALKSNAQLCGLLFAAGAVTTGFIGAIKDSGGRRILAILSLLVAAGIVSSVMFPNSPIGFERLQKVAAGENTDSESSGSAAVSPQAPPSTVTPKPNAEPEDEAEPENTEETDGEDA